MRFIPVLAVPALAAAALVVVAPALADDDEYGAYLFSGDCASFSSDSVIEDLGDLDREEGASKEWARVSPDNAQMPNPVYIEDESTGKVTADELAEGGFAVAVTETDSPKSAVLACGELPSGLTLPFVGDIGEMDRSGTAGRIAIETHRKGVKITAAAFAKESVPSIAR